MPDFVVSPNKPSRWLYAVPITFLLLFIIGFWKEIGLVLTWLVGWIRVIFSVWPIFLWLNADVRSAMSGQFQFLWTEPTQQAFLTLGANCLVGVLVFGAMIFWVAQFVLPVRTMRERRMAADRLWRYLWSSHGPAIFVKEGQIISDEKETIRQYPGVALVDLKSAVVLESPMPPSAVSPDRDSEDDVGLPVKPPVFRFKNGNKPRPSFTAHGPSLVFTNWRQSVRGAVDLRKQVRAAPEVDAYTRDGIKVTSTVFAIFSLSEEPETILVTYLGDIREKNPENVYAVSLEKKTNERGQEHEEVTALYRLNPLDANEVLRNYRSGNNYDSSKNENPERRHPSQPFAFHADRVISAVCYPPYRAEAHIGMRWDEIPTMAAVEEYRNTVARFTYDYMHMPDDPSEFPLKKIKQEFSFAVRSKGVMRYQMATPREGRPPLALAVGDTWPKADMVLWTVRDFTNPQVLRQRGIRVISAGFSEFTPPEQVKSELINNWRARYEKEINSKLAKRDLEAARIRNRAIIKSQQDASFVLSDVFGDAPYSEEALTVRVFQALETAATVLSESRLLPQDTINMLWALYQWMIPEEEKPEKPAASAGTVSENPPGKQE